jgi:hypothetical protein
LSAAGLVRAEGMKIRTTPAWWLFAGGFAALAALAVLFGWALHHAELYPPANATNASGALAQAAAPPGLGLSRATLAI